MSSKAVNRPSIAIKRASSFASSVLIPRRTDPSYRRSDTLPSRLRIQLSRQSSRSDQTRLILEDYTTLEPSILPPTLRACCFFSSSPSRLVQHLLLPLFWLSPRSAAMSCETRKLYRFRRVPHPHRQSHRRLGWVPTTAECPIHRVLCDEGEPSSSPPSTPYPPPASTRQNPPHNSPPFGTKSSPSHPPHSSAESPSPQTPDTSSASGPTRSET